MTVIESSGSVNRTLTKLGKTGSMLLWKEMPWGRGRLEKKPENPRTRSHKVGLPQHPLW